MHIAEYIAMCIYEWRMATILVITGMVKLSGAVTHSAGLQNRA
jgi:hypothetical protein